MFGDYHVYFHNFYLHGLGRKPVVKQILKFLLDNTHLTIFTQSEGEIDYYRSLSTKASLKFIPFCSDFTPITGQFPTEAAIPESYIFTGGYTNRDYPLMFSLASRFPDQKFVFVASSLNGISVPPSLSNVTLLCDLPKNQFESLLAGAEIVVVPLKEDVGASGQMLAISAMRNGKPIIYTDLPVISYFFSNGSGLSYKMGDIESLSAALSAYLSDEAVMQSNGQAALDRSRQFTIANQTPLIYESMGLSHQ